MGKENWLCLKDHRGSWGGFHLEVRKDRKKTKDWTGRGQGALRIVLRRQKSGEHWIGSTVRPGKKTVPSVFLCKIRKWWVGGQGKGSAGMRELKSQMGEAILERPASLT